MKFNKNLSIIIKNNRIISRQNGSTPGVYKFFNVEPNTKYKINLDGYNSRVATTLWMVDNEKTSNDLIRDVTDLYYQSNNQKIVKIGVLFKYARYGNYFDLDDIYLTKIDNYENTQINNSIVNNLNDEILKEYYLIKDEINKLSISIIIPCHYKHFKYLSQLLSFYNHQTIIQKEIIVVLSQSNMLDEKNIEELKNNKYLYELKIICVKEKSPAGRNRHLGSKDATGDIIIFQDADDLPHLQRNEIIYKCFINYPQIDHILHGYSRYHIIYKKYNINNIPIKIFNHNMFYNHNEMASYNLTNGNIAIRKNVIDKVKWEDEKYRGQDVIFNKNLYTLLRKYLIIRLPLYVYREKLSVKKYVIDNNNRMRFNI